MVTPSLASEAPPPSSFRVLVWLGSGPHPAGLGAGQPLSASADGFSGTTKTKTDGPAFPNLFLSTLFGRRSWGFSADARVGSWDGKGSSHEARCRQLLFWWLPLPGDAGLCSPCIIFLKDSVSAL